MTHIKSDRSSAFSYLETFRDLSFTLSNKLVKCITDIFSAFILQPATIPDSDRRTDGPITTACNPDGTPYAISNGRGSTPSQTFRKVVSKEKPNLPKVSDKDPQSRTVRRNESIRPSATPKASAAPRGTPIHLRNTRVVAPKYVKGKIERQISRCYKQMKSEENKKFYFEIPSSTESKQFKKTAATEYETGKVGDKDYGVCHARGRRPTMEDQHIATSFKVLIGKKLIPVELYGVFDGHGGPGAAIYVKNNIQAKLKEHLKTFNKNELSDAGIFNALKIATYELHSEFKGERDSSGTTATFCLKIGSDLWTANVGDSRTILQSASKIYQLSEDAKPDDPYYLRGIQKRGGYVGTDSGCPRINDKLAVGRSIGDFEAGQGINPRPKITKYSLAKLDPDSHLILACDGIYDVANTVQVGSAANLSANHSATKMAEALVYSAYISGSTDNLSALVVKLN